MYKKTLFVIAILSILASCSKKEKLSSILDQNFNEGWLFQKDTIPNGSAIAFDDSNWRKLDLPHDWAIEGPFNEESDLRVGGLPVHGEAWYRKHFTIDNAYQDKQISIEFDGAMNLAKVWLNGEYIGERPNGYIGFEFNLTKNIKFGEDNVIAVQLSPKELSSRWYPGAGIYRNVRLKINESVHIPQWGTYITTPNISKEKAEVIIETKIKNTYSHVTTSILKTEILNDAGEIIATNESEVEISANSIEKKNVTLNVMNPKLWDITSPTLYKVKTTVLVENKETDVYETPFGIRTIKFEREAGFLLNGNKVELNGVCLHHDQGPLGTAINFRAKQRQLETMQKMGVNAIRTSHNPPSPELLQICDELGLVVIVEAFDEWKKGKVINGYNNYFDEWHEKDLRDMIKRDRNHPSVIMWSIGNEILEQGQKEGWKLAKILNDICHDEDNTRPTTAGFNYFPAPFDNKLVYQVDIVGMNYWPERYKQILNENPELILYGSETSSMTSSRGVYHLPIEYKEKHETNQVSSYDAIVGPPWSYLPEVEFDAQLKEPRSLGEFIWTGTDYIGEPTPYAGRDNSTNGRWKSDWPSRSSYFGPVDLSGLPKDRFYLYQSQWTTEPMVHLLPHWNWEGKEGEEIPVFVYTNAEEAELFLNGKSLGKKVKGVDETDMPAEYHDFKRGLYPSKYRLSWNVPYTTGSLKVIAYTNNKTVAEKEIKTATKPTKIALSPDRNTITADGKDLSYITVNVNDANDVNNPLADNLIQFQIEGEGTIVGVGNGDATATTSFQAKERKAFSGKCMLIVKSTKNKGVITITATSKGLESQIITLNTN